MAEIYEKEALVPFGALKPSMTKVVLWNNNSPAEAFAPRTVNLNDHIDNYDMIVLLSKINKDSLQYLTDEVVIVDGGSAIYYFNETLYHDVNRKDMRISRISAHEAVFENGYVGDTLDNTKMIPVKIIGIKFNN